MAYHVGDRVCIKGWITTNNQLNPTDKLENDYKREEFSVPICGTIISLEMGKSISVKLDNGRYAFEVDHSQITNSPNNHPLSPPSPPNNSNCNFNLLEYVIVSGTIITQTHPLATLYTSQFFPHIYGTILRINNNKTYFIKFKEDLYGIDVPCSMIHKSYTNISNYINPEVPSNFLPIVNGTTDIKGFYPALNADPIFQKEVVRFFRNKIIDDWLYDRLKPLLNFFEIDDGKVRWISESTQKIKDVLDENTDSDIVIDKKAKFIKEHVLSKKMIKNILEKFIVENNVSWYDLKKLQKALEKKFLVGLYKKFKKSL